MRILVVGSGAREHAIIWKLAQNATVDKLFAVPGNAGIADIAECFDADPSDVETISNLADDLGCDMTVVGPEAPLVEGLVDELESRGFAAFGPSRAASRIEGSKAWAKQILAKAGAPTARAEAFTDAAAAVSFLDALEAPYVVKADGLAAGKGVTIAEDRDAAIVAIEDCLVRGRFGDAGATVVLEEHLEGEEMSLFCLSDGRTVLPLEPAQDFKRIGDGDTGPNTGGMGAYSPMPQVQPDLVRECVTQIFEPVVRAMASEGAPFKGLLFGGLMLTKAGPKVIEFNCRFGDPETQVLLPRLESDLAELLLACVEGNLSVYRPKWRAQASVGVVLASGGYPGSYETGNVIGGLGAASAMRDVFVFHAGTARAGADVVTFGGRVLTVSALGSDLADARDRAYEAAELVQFDGKYVRRDIARTASIKVGS